jgi:hypothetical protein
MSALWPHILALRALSQGFDETAEAMQGLNIEDPVAGAMLNVAAAFERAADLLEAGQQEILEKFQSKPEGRR